MEPNTFEQKILESLVQSSKIVARIYISQLFEYFQTIDKETKNITEQEMLDVVHLENFAMSGGTPGFKNKTNRRNKIAKMESSKVDEGDHNKTVKDGDPSIDRCGYFFRFGGKPGHYCNNKVEGKIYQLDEGPRRFCERCIKGKNVVKDITTGKSTTLIIQKGKPGNRRGKNKNIPPETPTSNKPGDFSSATPTDAPLQNLIPFALYDEHEEGGPGLYGVGSTQHIVLQDDVGRVGLVATKTEDGNLVSPTEESRNWAIDNLVNIIDKPELFDDDEEEIEVEEEGTEVEHEENVEEEYEEVEENVEEEYEVEENVEEEYEEVEETAEEEYEEVEETAEEEYEEEYEGVEEYEEVEEAVEEEYEENEEEVEQKKEKKKKSTDKKKKSKTGNSPNTKFTNSSASSRPKVGGPSGTKSKKSKSGAKSGEVLLEIPGQKKSKK